MEFNEFGRKSLPCGTISYSYKLCVGGYMIKIANLDTGKEKCTAGINVSSDYISVIMTHLLDSDITLDNMNEFLINELNEYPSQQNKRKHNKYLYL